MARGRDVIVPQFLADEAEIAAFEAVAREHAARFLHGVLLHERAESIDRLGRRRDDSEWGVHNRALVDRHGGPVLLLRSANADRSPPSGATAWARRRSRRTGPARSATSEG